MNKISIYSYAKINIGLNIIRKRDDGYHNLETIFYPLLLCDKLKFEKANVTTIESDSGKFNSLKENLINNAKELLEKYVESELNVKIYVEKNIPIGGGLGGGSSNAASTLKALNEIFNLNLDYNELAKIALHLGSDVPFFLNPVPCIATSRGEIMHKIPVSVSNPILLVNPGIHISTKWAFEQIEIVKQNNKLKKLVNRSVITLDDIKTIASNDFEECVFKKYPVIEEIKNKLYSMGAEFALMTGTGSTVYGIFNNLQKARWAREEFASNYFTYLNYTIDKGSIT